MQGLTALLLPLLGNTAVIVGDLVDGPTAWLID